MRGGVVNAKLPVSCSVLHCGGAAEFRTCGGTVGRFLALACQMDLSP